MIFELGLDHHLIHRLVLLWSESLIEVAHLAHLAHLGCHHHGRREARRRRRGEGGGNLFWDGFTAKAGSALAARGAAGRQAGRQDSCEGVADGPGGTALQLAGPFAGLGLFS